MVRNVCDLRKLVALVCDDKEPDADRIENANKHLEPLPEAIEVIQ